MYQNSLCIRIPYVSEPTAHDRVCSLLLSCNLQNKCRGNFCQAEFSEPAFSLVLTMSTLKHRQKFFLHHSMLKKYRTMPRGKKIFLLGQRRSMSCLCAVAAQQNCKHCSSGFNFFVVILLMKLRLQEGRHVPLAPF